VLPTLARSLLRLVGMKVKEVMRTRNLLSVRSDDDLAMGMQIMRWAGVRHVPVVDDGQVVGILTERDLLRYRAETGGTGGQDPVRRFMTSPAEVIGPEEDLAQASALMVGRRIGCLPVVEDGQLVGMLTVTDVVGLPLARAAATGAAGQARVEVAMKRDPATVPPYFPLLEAVGIMVDRGIRHVPVVDDQGRVVGILSDRDVRTALGDPLEALRRELPEVEELKVSGVMTTDVSTVREDAPLADAARHFIDERIGALPVVDVEGRLVGILSYVDVIRALQESLAAAA
jgi:CBS domain-containing protein